MGEALGAKMVIGGVTNGFESVIRQTLEGKGINFKTLLLDAGIGAATAGVFNGAEKLFQKASPFVRKAFSKIASNISDNTRIAKIALENMENGPKSVVLGSNLGNVDEALGRFTKEFKKVKKGSAGVGEVESRVYDPSKPMSQSNYPNPDTGFTEPPVRYEPKTIEEVERMRKGKGPTTKATHGDKNIEAHHRGQKSMDNGGILDDLEEYTHRRGGNHTRHTEPSELTPAQRAKEIREYWKKRGSKYVLPGEGI
ncbi:HNH/ENDO VII family nuclease [Clostridium estertheticum]|uniref:HNH/ENDO VII family nuclease n=1 Tax=Clostridium estertheticum TaxID=238834 RepID=UPI001C0BE509|nr:HNH/ENDO VII family nuclease [Clostridium estertheticum]MBU3174527.1 hypothetical protein [Clostridium estertheticum]